MPDMLPDNYTCHLRIEGQITDTTGVQPASIQVWAPDGLPTRDLIAALAQAIIEHPPID